MDEEDISVSDLGYNGYSSVSHGYSSESYGKTSLTVKRRARQKQTPNPKTPRPKKRTPVKGSPSVKSKVFEEIVMND